MRRCSTPRSGGAQHVSRRGWPRPPKRGLDARDPDAPADRTAWLMGADGANSLVRRRVGRPFPRDALSVASGFYVHDRTGAEIDIEFTRAPRRLSVVVPAAAIISRSASAARPTRPSSAPLLGRTAMDPASTSPGRPALTRYSWPIPSLAERRSARRTPGGRSLAARRRRGRSRRSDHARRHLLRAPSADFAANSMGKTAAALAMHDQLRRTSTPN